jgi:fatty acid-binding protein DegV
MGEIKLTDKIAMLVDSGMDMPPELIEKGGVFVAPLNIMYTDKTYMDKIEISAAEIYARLDKEVPKTSLPSISYVQTLIEDIKNQGYNKILCITISSGLILRVLVLAAGFKQLSLNEKLIMVFLLMN